MKPFLRFFLCALYVSISITPHAAPSDEAAAMMQTQVSSGGLPITGNPMIASITPGTVRNDFSGQVGFKFFANANMTVTALGRWVVSGNTFTHIVSIYDGSFTLLASITVPTAGQTSGAFTYVELPSSVSLTLGDPYYLFSTETSSGDQWLDLNTDYTCTTPADFGGIGAYVVLSGTPTIEASGTVAYVPPTMRYTKP